MEVHPRCPQHHVPSTTRSATSTRLGVSAIAKLHRITGVQTDTTRTLEEAAVAVDEGPTLRRRRLAAELKKCREDAGLTQEYVSRHFEWHSAKVTRIENARVPVTPRDVN